VSEQAPEAPPPAAGGGGGGGAGGFLKRKLGPFPMWAWLVIGAALIGMYVIYKRNQASQAAATSTAATSTDASQIPQFVNQTYTTVTPPAAPTPAAGPPPPVVTNPGGPMTPPPKSRPTQITATGADTGDINQIAKQYGLTETQLIAANPGLRRLKVRVGKKSVPLIGSGAPIPKGTVVKIPAVGK
jgi:hypothetical protein